MQINLRERKERRYLNQSSIGGGQRSCACILFLEEIFIKDNMLGHINSCRDRIKTSVTTLIRAVAKEHTLFTTKS